MHTKTIRIVRIPISDNYFVTLFNALSPQFHEYSNKTINDEQKGRLKLLVTTRKKSSCNFAFHQLKYYYFYVLFFIDPFTYYTNAWKVRNCNKI